MKTSDLNHFKQLLDSEQARLQELLARTGKHLYRREEPYNADFAEQAVETQNNEVVEHIDQEAQASLDQIEKALHRIANGSYGVCLQCGEDINTERLRAIPYTDVCIRCADQ